MTEYQVFLKNEKTKFYSRFGWLIIIVNFFAILITTYYLNKFHEMKWVLLILTLVTTGIFIFKHYFKKPFLGNAKHLPGFLFILPAWLQLGFPWMAGLNIFLLFFSTIAARVPVVYLNQTAIYFPSFPKKQIQWEELSNVILKDGYLTIDFKNNKLIQQLIDENNTMVSEKEFNDFCQLQLNK